MNKNFTFCPNSSKLSQEVNELDFFANLFEAHWEIFGFQVVFLAVTFGLILPLTFAYIEVL